MTLTASQPSAAPFPTGLPASALQTSGAHPYDLTDPHIIRMALYSLRIAATYGISESHLLDEVYFTAILHDVGKIAIREDILKKPSPLDPEERAHMETHAVIGGAMVHSFPGWERIVAAVRAHHEWWDGSGYPDGLRGDEIPLPARIVAIADVLDALTRPRPYRSPIRLSDALKYIYRMSGSHFDPALTATLRHMAALGWRRLYKEATTFTSLALLRSHFW